MSDSTTSVFHALNTKFSESRRLSDRNLPLELASTLKANHLPLCASK